MALFILLLFTCTFISRFKCSDEQKDYTISIDPVEVTEGQLVRRIDDILNLTCTVTLKTHAHLSEFKITWHTPNSPKNSQHRVSNIPERNRMTLVVDKLQESDSGDYKCEAVGSDDQTQLQKVVRVNVKQKKPRCTDSMFLCPITGTCIQRRYLCDGFADCKNGFDETEERCGPNACEGKLMCENNRCIPYTWCCTDYMGPNCTVKVRPQCCPKLTTGDMDADMGYPASDQQRFNDMGFLQTTIYTVIGCAMAFMFIVTILVIAICRVHMKRSLLSRCPGARLPARGGTRGPHHHHAMQHVPLYDLDVFLNRQDISPHSGLLVTYNINNGVQFVGRPVDPPPYCEIVASPPREGPPPPYASRESLVRVPLDTNEEDEGPGEGDSLLGSTRHGEEDSPIVRQSNNTLRVTVVHSTNAGMGHDYMGMYGVRENSSTNHGNVSNHFSVIADEASSPVSNTSVTDADNSSSIENVAPTSLLNCNVGANCANNDRLSEDTNENAVNISNCNEYRPLLSESLAGSPKVHQPTDVPDESFNRRPCSPQSKLSCNPSTQEDGSFNIHEGCENPVGHLRESFIGMRDSAGSEALKLNDTLPAHQDVLTQCGDSREGLDTDINRTQFDNVKD